MGWIYKSVKSQVEVISMNRGKFDEFVKSRYRSQVEWYDKKSRLNKRLAYSFQISIVIVAAIIPIFAALGYVLLTIISAAIISAGTGVLKFCRFEDLWHNYRTTCETLKREMVFYKTRADIYGMTRDTKKLFINRVESITSKEHGGWVSTMKEKSKSMGGGA